MTETNDFAEFDRVFFIPGAIDPFTKEMGPPGRWKPIGKILVRAIGVESVVPLEDDKTQLNMFSGERVCVDECLELVMAVLD